MQIFELFETDRQVHMAPLSLNCEYYAPNNSLLQKLFHGDKIYEVII